MTDCFRRTWNYDQGKTIDTKNYALFPAFYSSVFGATLQCRKNCQNTLRKTYSEVAKKFMSNTTNILHAAVFVEDLMFL